jgi:signal transduction histidine kinase
MIVGMTASAPAPAGADAAVPGHLLDRLRTPLVQLNLIGIVLVAVGIVPSRIGPITAAGIALGTVALAGWAIWVLTPLGRVRTVALLVSGPVAAVGAGLGAPALIAPVIASLVVTSSDIARTWRSIAPVAAVDVAGIAIAGAAHGLSLEGLLSLLAGVAFGVLGGYSRRERRRAEEQTRALFASTLAAERETERAALLEARSAAARDVHDVLAHSLGGLVLQLDAIEALLEHGRADEAATRAAEARRLAGEGLAEARHAVAALRDPGAVPPARVPDDALEALLAAHRSLGGIVRVEGASSLQGVDGPHREALAGALREALVNARRHAPGRPVAVRLEREPHAMVVRVQNALDATAPATVGGGHGLAGMRERFAALGDGSAAVAGARDGDFVVEARAVLP